MFYWIMAKFRDSPMEIIDLYIRSNKLVIRESNFMRKFTIMLKIICFYLLSVLITGQALGQEDAGAVAMNAGDPVHTAAPSDTGRAAVKSSVYTIKPVIDIPVTAAAAAWTFYGFAQVSKKSSTSLADIQSLNKSSIPWYDRWAVRPYNKSVDKLSYMPFYAAVPYPVIFFAFDKKMRKDYIKLTFLYTQAMAMTGVLYTTATHYFSRLRPLVYSPESPIDTRTSSNSKIGRAHV